MIRLHCTKKLSAKLSVDKQGFLLSDVKNNQDLESPKSESALGDWHANLLTLQRRNCILFVHDTTRFPLLLTCLVKKDYANLDYWFGDALINTLLKLGATQSQLDAAADSLQPLCIDNYCDRSVQGTLNRMKGDIEQSLWFNNAKVEDLSPYLTAVWLANRPCNL